MLTFNRLGYHGRFGNQLFQFATAFSVSKKLNYDLVLPKQNLYETETHYADVPFNAYCNLLECFKINENYFKIIDKNAMNNYSERHFHFDPNVFNVPNNTSLNGYFQSEKYFLNCLDELLEELTFRTEIIEAAKDLLPKVDKELVSIHVRRGDSTLNLHYHSLIGLEFINPAIDTYFNTDKYHFCVFSDDIEWCRNVWGGKENFTLVKGNNQHEDFAAMSLCDHHIIGNSTFSWWSSYLSKNKNKMVIAPKNWFGPGYAHYSLEDLYPQNCIIL
jgi:hypothetical protein